MKKVFLIIYVVAAAITAVVTTILQIQPALFFIEFFAPEEGDKFSVKLVVLLTLLVLLLPALIINIILIFKRKIQNKNVVVESWQTGVLIARKKQLQSAIVGISININDKKVGVIDIGEEKFFEAPIGKIKVIAGEGKQASVPLEVDIKASEKIKLKLELVPNGLALKNVLTLA